MNMNMNMNMYQMTSMALSTYSDIVETPLDINSLIKQYQITNTKGFKIYLSEMFKVLNKYSDDVIKGINFSSFKKVRKNYKLYNSFILISLVFYPEDYSLCSINQKVAI